jgi:hypothetical protein
MDEGEPVMGDVVRVRRHNFMPPGQRKKALRSLELYLDGKRWSEIAKNGGMTWRTFAWTLAQYPDLSKAWQEARKNSAHSFEDRALELAEELVSANKFSGTQVRAHEVAMNQYRWSAARRNPTEYAEAAANKVSVVVPIQINSSLNLAEGGREQDERTQDDYQFAAGVLPEVPKTPEVPQEDIVDVLEDAGYEIAFDIPAPPEAESELEVQSDQQEPQSPPADALEALATRLGLPDEVPAVIKRRPPPGKLPKKHKDARLTSVTKATMLKSASRNPVVARALETNPKEHSNGRKSTGDKWRAANSRRAKPVQQPPSGDGSGSDA